MNTLVKCNLEALVMAIHKFGEFTEYRFIVYSAVYTE